MCGCTHHCNQLQQVLAFLRTPICSPFLRIYVCTCIGFYLHFYWTLVYWRLNLCVRITERVMLCWIYWCDSGWSRYQLIANRHYWNASAQLEPTGGQIWKTYKWRQLVAKSVTNASGATWLILTDGSGVFQMYFHQVQPVFAFSKSYWCCCRWIYEVC